MIRMPRTRIKIDGICRAADAVAAVDAGVDAIGMVFDPAAPRCVSMQQAREIVAAVSPLVSIVGLFVDADAESIRQVMDEIPLSAVQLHGRETPQLVAELRPIRVIKALRTDEADALPVWLGARGDMKLTNLIGIVMDTSGMPGGSGVANDWKRLHELKRAGGFGGLGALIVAGGLTPANVGDVVALLRPFAVDVSSGVESTKREKSPEKIAAFVRAVRDADSRM
jgi:phosphoribosylanthranilate isomerase